MSWRYWFKVRWERGNFDVRFRGFFFLFSSFFWEKSVVGLGFDLSQRASDRKVSGMMISNIVVCVWERERERERERKKGDSKILLNVRIFFFWEGEIRTSLFPHWKKKKKERKKKKEFDISQSINKQTNRKRIFDFF